MAAARTALVAERAAFQTEVAAFEDQKWHFEQEKALKEHHAPAQHRRLQDFFDAQIAANEKLELVEQEKKELRTLTEAWMERMSGEIDFKKLSHYDSLVASNLILNRLLDEKDGVSDGTIGIRKILSK